MSAAENSTDRHLPDIPPVRPLYFVALGVAIFGVFFAVLTPVYVSMQLKAQALFPDDATEVIGQVLPLGAFAAMIANPVAGALSDRTRSRFGRRRPWLVGGTLGMIGALVWLAYASTVIELVIAWLLVQTFTNTALSAATASFADNVPHSQRAKGSSTISLAQNTSILAGTYLSVPLVESLPLLFILPGVVSLLCVVVYGLIAKDELPDKQAPRLSIRDLVDTFWTSPRKHPDFGFAWLSRFLIVLATFMFTTYRLLYMQQHIGLPEHEATKAVATGVLFYTIALLITAAASGWASDRLNRRKPFVAIASLVFGIGLVVLAGANSVGHFYIAEIIMGAAYGCYTGVDVALVVDVLPDPLKPGKDMGVFNIAQSLPQSFAPAISLWLLHWGVGAENYAAMCWGAGFVAAFGAIAIIPIRSVK
ncbi:MFS transporter [Streptomyces sp. SID8361]|uniref:MFS transporter n=1 Tax=Streptomyces sp. MnatMP-M27 TaxID=1839768 RepID=UPI00144FB0D3|nr:MFS transporter [Streptomyces sp. MnatMP-M27]MYU10410.1 MFS transporter [Streptomyces sp. SID8361]